MVRNRCKFGKEALGIYKTYEELQKQTLCSGFFWVKESKRDQKFCDRMCQIKYNKLIKNYEKTIEDETWDAIIAWLDKHPEEYKYEIIHEIGNRAIKTMKVGSSLYKITDNQKDASDTLKNLT